MTQPYHRWQPSDSYVLLPRMFLQLVLSLASLSLLSLLSLLACDDIPPLDNRNWLSFGVPPFKYLYYFEAQDLAMYVIHVMRTLGRH